MTRIFVILFSIVLISACGNENSQKDNSSNEATEDLQVTQPIQSPSPETKQTPATVNIPAGADGIVHHYICADGCEGGFGNVNSPCPGCGKTLAHNKAFHSQDNAATNPLSSDGNTIVNQVPPPTKEPAPAQNAAGVWHYTCPTGCAGGGGAMGACSGCGGQLVHNKAYH